MENFTYKKIISDENFGVTYNCEYSVVTRIFSDVSLEEYIGLVQDMQNNAYPELQSFEIDKFCAHTFEADDSTVVISYDKAIQELRLVKDPFSKRLNYSFDKAGKCPVKLWQYEIDHSLIDCGMCYIFQCSDYSFFIIDSPHVMSINDDIRIFDFLRSKTPENLPVVVSGWFFSHGHVDHIGKFMDILKYNNDIIIKGLYYNFVSNNHFSSENWLYSDIKFTEIFLDEVSKRSDIPVYLLHSGQSFYVECLKIDVLCTHEDVYPQSLENYNDSSTVITVTVESDKICFPGDAGHVESNIVERRFPEFLNCDIIQVAHHGHFGTTSQFYRLCDARVALFPVTQIKFDEEYQVQEANRTACELAKHIFIASNGTTEFTFPLEKSDIILYPDETFENFEGIYNLWAYEYSEEYKQKLKEQFEASDKLQKISY